MTPRAPKDVGVLWCMWGVLLECPSKLATLHSCLPLMSVAVLALIDDTNPRACMLARHPSLPYTAAKAFNY